jgi:hypothetical protein
MFRGGMTMPKYRKCPLCEKNTLKKDGLKFHCGSCEVTFDRKVIVNEKGGKEYDSFGLSKDKIHKCHDKPGEQKMTGADALVMVAGAGVTMAERREAVRRFIEDTIRDEVRK